MSAALTEQEVLDVLHAVERDEVTLLQADVARARAQYVGILRFQLSNGWILTVFNDCRAWDYLEEAETPDGRILTYDEIWESYAQLHAYKPPDPKLWGLDR